MVLVFEYGSEIEREEERERLFMVMMTEGLMIARRIEGEKTMFSFTL